MICDVVKLAKGRSEDQTILPSVHQTEAENVAYTLSVADTKYRYAVTDAGDSGLRLAVYRAGQRFAATR